MSMRRDASDPSGLGVHPNWGFAWPANRRVLYNRASADPDGKAWSERKKYITWNGSRWVGADVPDYAPTVAPDKSVGPFIMNPEGTARLFVAHDHDGRAVPRALRADGRLHRQSAASQGQHQSGGAGVRGRCQVVRHARQVPDRGDLLSPRRALPLLDQERPRQCRGPAGDVRRDGRAAGQGQGHQERRLGRGVEPARHDQGQGLGIEAFPADHGRRQAVRRDRVADPLRLRRR